MEHKHWMHSWNFGYDKETYFDPFTSWEPSSAKAPPKPPPKALTKLPPKASPKRPPKPPINPKTRAVMNLYEILGVKLGSSPEDIKRAAKKRRVECHPDRLKRLDMSTAELQAIEDRAQRVGGAAEVLLDPELRKRYNRRLKQGRVA
ncbi:MAG: hypothetical protein Q9226_003042 [Calogaya cf. arnoldii]